MKTFIRAAELWVPSSDGLLLEFGGGLYGDAKRFGAVSRDLCFGLDEGLPGRAWQEGVPIVLKSFAGSYFQRTKAAQADGIDGGVALPLYAGGALCAVLVMFCGGEAAGSGAIELWHHDPAVSPAMRLVDGCYGTGMQALEEQARAREMRRGEALPGGAWARRGPIFIDEIETSPSFARSAAAHAAGIDRGFAWMVEGPNPAATGECRALAFLSADATPIARRIEVWQPDGRPGRYAIAMGHCEREGRLGPGHGASTVRVERGEGVVGRVFETGRPALTERAMTEPGSVGATASAQGFGPLLAMPLTADGELASVVAWYF